jgi:hypothetical protein
MCEAASSLAVVSSEIVAMPADDPTTSVRIDCSSSRAGAPLRCTGAAMHEHRDIGPRPGSGDQNRVCIFIVHRRGRPTSSSLAVCHACRLGR